MNKIKKPFSCGLGPAFDVIGGRWKSTILWELHAGPVRFGELKRRVAGITEKMLVAQLKEMEAHKLVVRQAYDTLPLRVEYSLTNQGYELNDSLDALAIWGKKFVKEMNLADHYSDDNTVDQPRHAD